ncbi:hypothetical protein ACF3MZ_24090 [Paenibacillaceae bacterium WGS1546]|uniref:hypothetical protein n=1 Tax=Cohnella sp. WGS1546 TaxID=3366810 RepID=UPI00372D2D00
MKLKTKIIILSLAIIFSGIVISMTYFLKQNPLTTTGFWENNQRTKVNIDLINKGISNIKILEVKVNNKIPLSAHLVISYSGQLVASASIDSDPLAKFLELDDALIHPELTAEEKEEEMKLKTQTTNYGIKIQDNEKIVPICKDSKS